MRRFSANLGFLWTDRPLPDAIHAATSAGFDAVECHWPYDTDPALIAAALRETNLPMLGLNTRRGDVSAGENGLCALPGREAEARDAIHQALDYAVAVGAGAVHVMSGVAEGDRAHSVFLENLKLATDLAAQHGIMILIEPLNAHDAPGYFLRDTLQACAIIDELGAENLKLMFDCYHVGRTEQDVSGRLHAVLPYSGHIQFASVPDRGPPDRGEVDYADIFSQIDALGWGRPLGAEYKPQGDTDASLGWLAQLRAP